MGWGVRLVVAAVAVWVRSASSSFHVETRSFPPSLQHSHLFPLNMTMSSYASTAAAAILALLAGLYTSAEAFQPKFISQRSLMQTHLSSAKSKTIVIGGGRIGSLISDGASLLGRNDSISSSIDADGDGPIYIATRNDVLESIVDECPLNRRKDLVFLQNGYLEEFLLRKDLGENTQALLYLSVASKGAIPVDGITSFNPEGLTAATGRHAKAFADRLAALGLKCNVVSTEEYRPAMFEKLMCVVCSFDHCT
jgi:hypothetical protein